MKHTLSNVLIFTVGAAIGSAVTYHLVKSKYEREIEELVDDFAQHREPVYRGLEDSDEAARIEQDDVMDDDLEEEPMELTHADYSNMIAQMGYRNYSDVEPTLMPVKKNDIPVEEDDTESAARVITPNEFGEVDYKIVELTYWADGVLTDNKNKRIQDVEALIGKTLARFGEYEPDALHVRNDEKKIDFEIMRDLKRYSDFFDDSDPHKAEDE